MRDLEREFIADLRGRRSADLRGSAGISVTPVSVHQRLMVVRDLELEFTAELRLRFEADRSQQAAARSSSFRVLVCDGDFLASSRRLPRRVRSWDDELRCWRRHSGRVSDAGVVGHRPYQSKRHLHCCAVAGISGSAVWISARAWR